MNSNDVAAQTEIMRGIRDTMYADLLKLGVTTDLPKERYNIRALWSLSVSEWSRDRAIAEGQREIQRHRNSGAEVFGSDEFTGDRR